MRALPLPAPRLTPHRPRHARRARPPPRRPLDDRDATLGIAGAPPGLEPGESLPLARCRSVTAEDLQRMIADVDATREAAHHAELLTANVWESVLDGCVDCGILDILVHQEAARRCRRLLTECGVLGARLAAAAAIVATVRDATGEYEGQEADVERLAQWARSSVCAVRGTAQVARG